MTKFQIFHRRVLFYIVVIMGCLTPAIDLDRSSMLAVGLWCFTLICFGSASYLSLKDCSNTEINKVIGIDVF